MIMGDVLFTFDVEAAPDAIRRALTTSEGIAGFWTDRAEVPAEVGGTLMLGFPNAPAPFDLVLSQSDDKMITWRTQTFPPQWVGTEIRWEISAGDGASTVTFRHGTFGDETEEGRVAFVWGQVMVQLKRHVETGVPAPVFVHPK
ncbi:MAG TPA: hypothetical protein VJN19_06390 [Propionibacteriaceae bacterium]|nr:hypothetical protein [Propionibacteriaceae bacterium]